MLALADILASGCPLKCFSNRKCGAIRVHIAYDLLVGPPRFLYLEKPATATSAPNAKDRRKLARATAASAQAATDNASQINDHPEEPVSKSTTAIKTDAGCKDIGDALRKAQAASKIPVLIQSPATRAGVLDEAAKRATQLDEAQAKCEEAEAMWQKKVGELQATLQGTKPLKNRTKIEGMLKKAEKNLELAIAAKRETFEAMALVQKAEGVAGRATDADEGGPTKSYTHLSDLSEEKILAMKNDPLRAQLSFVNLPTNGNKNEMQERFLNFFKRYKSKIQAMEAQGEEGGEVVDDEAGESEENKEEKGGEGEESEESEDGDGEGDGAGEGAGEGEGAGAGEGEGEGDGEGVGDGQGDGDGERDGEGDGEDENGGEGEESEESEVGEEDDEDTAKTLEELNARVAKCDEQLSLAKAAQLTSDKNLGEASSAFKNADGPSYQSCQKKQRLALQAKRKQDKVRSKSHNLGRPSR